MVYPSCVPQILFPETAAEGSWHGQHSIQAVHKGSAPMTVTSDALFNPRELVLPLG